MSRNLHNWEQLIPIDSPLSHRSNQISRTNTCPWFRLLHGSWWLVTKFGMSLAHCSLHPSMAVATFMWIDRFSESSGSDSVQNAFKSLNLRSTAKLLSTLFISFINALALVHFKFPFRPRQMHSMLRRQDKQMEENHWKCENGKKVREKSIENRKQNRLCVKIHIVHTATVAATTTTTSTVLCALREYIVRHWPEIYINTHTLLKCL